MRFLMEKVYEYCKCCPNYMHDQIFKYIKFQIFLVYLKSPTRYTDTLIRNNVGVTVFI